MSEADFKRQNRNSVLAYADEDLVVYRITKVVMTSHPGTMFYYFNKGKLMMMDQGQRRADLVIEVKK